MNKHLLLGSALLAAISAYPQAGRQVKPTGVINKQQELRKTISEENAKPAATPVGPVKVKNNSSANKAASSAATSCTHFSGSANAFGFYQDGHEGLQYNADVNAVSFVHRCAPSFTSIPNGNTGVMVAKWSVNNGTNWDSTVVWANSTVLARYPQGGIYNPPGNTNINNAYFVGMGEYTPGSGFAGSWAGSKKITTPGTNVAGTDLQSFPNTAPFGTLGKKLDFPRYGFTYTKDGVVRGQGEVVNDVNGTTNAAYGSRGIGILKGVFNAGAFVWSYDSLVPALLMRSDGTPQVQTRWSDMAWDDNGVVGYAMMIGARAGSTGTMRGYQPIVYKTTNSGASWSLLPANDFTTYQFQGLVDRLWSTNTNTNLVIPFFSGGEGMDMAVDAAGNLHLAITVVGTPIADPDSIDYNTQWGSQKYSYPYAGSFSYPTIYDFYTTGTAGWNYIIVDSMGTEGPSGTSGYPGYSYNPWASAAMPLTARIQICHSPDRTKMFYSWTETDTLITPGINWNQFPNIMMKGFDLTTGKMTPRLNVTGGVTSPSNADQTAYLHMMSNRSIVTNVSTGTNEIPLTITYNNTFDGNSPVDHFYLKGASFQNSDFTINSFHPVGVQNLSANNTANYEVSNFPNPAKGATTIVVNMSDAKPFEVSIHSAVGQLVKTINVNGQSGNNKVDVDLSNLSAGVYFYSVKANNSVVTKKMIVE